MTYYMMQDGANFYAYSDGEITRLVLRRTAPFKVVDGDMEAATRAREWFTNLCSAQATLVWEA